MRLVGQKLLTDFAKAHADARSPLQTWTAEVEDARWLTHQDVMARYPQTSFLRDRVAVFNIKGNRYRLVAQISFKNGIVQVQRVGTHAEYDTWTL